MNQVLVYFNQPLFESIYVNLFLAGMTLTAGLFAFGALWRIRVGGALTEKEWKAKKLPFWADLIWIARASALMMVISLVLLFFPVGKPYELTLVSRSSDPSSKVWQANIRDFKELIAKRISDKRPVIDVGPLVDIAIEKFVASDYSIMTNMERVRAIAIEVTADVDFGELVIVDKQVGPSSETNSIIPPRWIETLEIAILKALVFRLNVGPKSISYLVSERAQAYGWDWGALASYFPSSRSLDGIYSQACDLAQGGVSSAPPSKLCVTVVDDDSFVPILRQVLSVRETLAGKTEITTQFSLPKTNVKRARKWNLTLAFKRASGEVVSTINQPVEGNDSGVSITKIVSNLSLRQLSGVRLLQVSEGGVRQVLAEKILPTENPLPWRVYFDGPSPASDQWRKVFEALIGSSTNCLALTSFTEHDISVWRSSRRSVSYQDIKVTHDPSDADIIVTLLSYDFAAIRPSSLASRIIFKKQEGANIAVLPNGVNTMQAAERSVMSLGAVIARRRADAAGDVFSLEGMPFSEIAVLDILEKGPVRSIGGVTGLKSNYPLKHNALDSIKTEAADLQKTFLVPGTVSGLVRTMSYVAIDFEKNGLLCEPLPPDPDKFLASWAMIFELIGQAGKEYVDPRGSAVLDRSGAPLIILTKDDAVAAKLEGVTPMILWIIIAVAFFAGVATLGLLRYR
jgi:hypothetical protein